MPRFGLVVSSTLLFSYCERMILLACSSAKPREGRFGGRICRLWVTRCVLSLLEVYFGIDEIMQASRYIAGSFFVDSTGLFESQFQANVSPTIPASTTLQGAAGSKTQWLLLVRPQGVMEVSP